MRQHIQFTIQTFESKINCKVHVQDSTKEVFLRAIFVLTSYSHDLFGICKLLVFIHTRFFSTTESSLRDAPKSKRSAKGAPNVLFRLHFGCHLGPSRPLDFASVTSNVHQMLDLGCWFHFLDLLAKLAPTMRFLVSLCGANLAPKITLVVPKTRKVS